MSSVQGKFEDVTSAGYVHVVVQIVIRYNFVYNNVFNVQ